MKVFVAGGTGVLGRRVVPRLVEAGHEVRAIARTEDKAAEVSAVGAEPVRVGLFDLRPLAEAVDGSDVVINIATHIPDLAHAARSSAWRENDRIRIEGSRNLVDAALAAGASRYVQESLAFFYPDSGESWIDEDTPLDLPPIAAAVIQAESQAERFTASGGAGVVLRFGFFYGAGATHTVSQLKLARRGLSPFPGPLDAFQPHIHLDDAATAVVASLSVPAGVYNVTEDEPATRAELAAALADALGRRRPGRKIPGVSRLGGSKTEYFGRSVRPTNRRFRDASGWRPAFPKPALGWQQVVEESAKQRSS